MSKKNRRSGQRSTSSPRSITTEPTTVTEERTDVLKDEVTKRIDGDDVKLEETPEVQDIVKDDVTEDVGKDDVTEDEVKEDVTEDEVKEDVTEEVGKDDVTEDEVKEDVTEDEVKEDVTEEVGKDDVTEDEVKEDVTEEVEVVQVQKTDFGQIVGYTVGSSTAHTKFNSIENICHAIIFGQKRVFVNDKNIRNLIIKCLEESDYINGRLVDSSRRPKAVSEFKFINNVL